MHQGQKLAIVLATPVSITINQKASVRTLKALYQVLYILYSTSFEDGQTKIKILLDCSSEVNIMTVAYIVKLGLIIWKTIVNTQNIKSLFLKTYNIAFASLLS